MVISLRADFSWLLLLLGITEEPIWRSTVKRDADTKDNSCARSTSNEYFDTASMTSRRQNAPMELPHPYNLIGLTLASQS